MEAQLSRFKSGNRDQCFVTVAVALFAALNTAVCSAQAVRVASRSGDQQIVHSLRDTGQDFAPVRWDVANSRYRNGCIVEWTAEPFVHADVPSAQADCELSIRLVRGTRFADWTIASPSDASNVAGGKNKASVSLTSHRRGQAEVELFVRFVGPATRSLVSGRYQTTVVSTISGL